MDLNKPIQFSGSKELVPILKIENSNYFSFIITENNNGLRRVYQCVNQDDNPHFRDSCEQTPEPITIDKIYGGAKFKNINQEVTIGKTSYDRFCIIYNDFDVDIFYFKRSS